MKNTRYYTQLLMSILITGFSVSFIGYYLKAFSQNNYGRQFTHDIMGYSEIAVVLAMLVFAYMGETSRKWFIVLALVLSTFLCLLLFPLSKFTIGLIVVILWVTRYVDKTVQRSTLKHINCYSIKYQKYFESSRQISSILTGFAGIAYT